MGSKPAGRASLETASSLVFLLFPEHHLAVELLDLAAQHVEHLLALLGEGILLARPRPGIGIDLELEPAALFHPVEQRIERARAHLVTVAPKLAEHPLAEDGLRLGVVKDVDLPERQQDLVLELLHGASYYDNRSRLSTSCQSRMSRPCPRPAPPRLCPSGGRPPEGAPMSGRTDFFFRQKVTEAELDLAFELIELADRNLAADIGVYGIISGAEPTPHSPVPNLTINLTAPTRAYDNLGQRIFFATGQVGDCSVDLTGIPTEVVQAGHERWLGVFLRLYRLLFDPRTDR